MSLLGLPPELLQEICRQCERTTDIPNLRLTCRDLRAAADEFLLESHSILYHKGHIERLKQIAATSYGLRKGIKRFTFNVVGLAALHTLDEWFEERYTSFNKWSAPEEWKLTRNEKEEEMPDDIWKLKPWYDENIWIQWHPNKSLPLSQARYQIYSKLLDYQVQLERDSNLRRKLSHFFKVCPKISSLRFVTKSLNRQHDETYRSGLVIPWRDELDASAQFQETILAAHDGELRITELIMSKLVRSLCDIDPNWLIMPEIHKVLHHIEDLSLKEGWLNGKVLPPTLRNGRIAQILGHCTSLRRLYLRGPHDIHISRDAFDEVPLPLHDVVGNHTWTRLESLSLLNLHFTSHELASLMLRHFQTLETILLDNLFVTDNDWPICFGMFAGKLPHLKSVTIRGSFLSRNGVYVDYYFMDPKPSDDNEDIDDPKPFEQWIIEGGDGPPYLPGYGPHGWRTRPDEF